MSIGAGGLLGSNVQLNSGQTVNVSNATTINSGSILTLNDGAFSSGLMTNNGDIVLNGPSSRLGGALSNNALVKGSGRVEAQVSNNAGAQIRVASGESMRFTSAGNSNAGRIEVIGGEIEFDQNLVNQGATGNIVARDAKLRFNGGLDNEGSMGLSFGTTDVFGDIDNTGSVVITGNSNATFYDDYINNGITTTSIGSNAVFFGSVSGSGSYIGGGTLFFCKNNYYSNICTLKENCEGAALPAFSRSRVHLLGPFQSRPTDRHHPHRDRHQSRRSYPR